MLYLALGESVSKEFLRRGYYLRKAGLKACSG